MIIPLRTDSPLRTTPYMNWAVIAANVIIFMMSRSYPQIETQYALSARAPQLFQYFTYQFLHGGAMHLIGNMLFLFIFGNNVNDRLGNIGYLALYLAGGVFAGISYVITSDGAVGIVGASGSIATITGAYLMLLPRSNVTVFYFWMLFGVTEVSSLYFIVGFFIYDIFLNFSVRDGVAHTAHIGGTIFGALLCILLLATHLLPRDPFDVVALIQRWNRRRQYRDMVAGGYNPFEYTQPAKASYFSKAIATPGPIDPKTSRVLEMRSEVAEALLAHKLELASRLYIDLKVLDPQQVLPRQQQLDVANELAQQQKYPQAAEAYELFLSQYPKAEQVAQVELMLGIIYARYLQQTDRAREYLTRATMKYHDGRELELAKEELGKLAGG